MINAFKTLLALFTALAVGLTGLLLFYHDKNGPRYIHIYGDEF